jgi:anti-anti-sigma regulatory factor
MTNAKQTLLLLAIHGFISVPQACKRAQSAGLLLELVDTPVQDIADADHANKAFALHDWNVSNIARQHIRLVVCDLSASPHLDLAGSRMLHQLHDELAHHDIDLRIVAARGRVRDLLRADGIGEKVGGLDRLVRLDGLLGSLDRQG